MTGQVPSPAHAWQMALDTLRMEMPKASFDTWVRDADFIAYNDGTFTIGVANGYAREWLDSRLTPTVSRILSGIINTARNPRQGNRSSRNIKFKREVFSP